MTARSITPSPAEEIRPIDRSTSLLLVQLLLVHNLFDSFFLLFHICHLFAKEGGNSPNKWIFYTKS